MQAFLLILLAVAVVVATLLVLRSRASADAPPHDERPLFVLIVLLALAIIAALIIDAIAGSASASPSNGPSGGSKLSAPRPTGTVGPTSLQYQTVGTNVRLRAAATTDSAILTVMLDRGSPVVLSCYQSGQYIFGDPYWYRANYGTLHGYVSGFWVDTGPDPAATHLPSC